MPETLTTIDEFEAAVDASLDAQADGAEPEPAEEPTAETPPMPSLDELRARHYEAIREQNHKVAEALLEFEDSNAATKRLKKRYENLQGQLNDLIEQAPRQHQLPFGDEASASADAQAWKLLDVGCLEIPDGLTDKLRENGLSTLGALQDFWQTGEQLTKFAGIGEEKSALVSDAFAEYGAEHPEVFGEQEVEEQAGEPEATEDDTAAPTEDEPAV